MKNILIVIGTTRRGYPIAWLAPMDYIEQQTDYTVEMANAYMKSKLGMSMGENEEIVNVKVVAVCDYPYYI